MILLPFDSLCKTLTGTHYHSAEKYLQQGLTVADGLGDRWFKAWYLSVLGKVRWGKGEYERAESLAQESYQILRELGDRADVCASLLRLGLITVARGRYDSARQHYQDSLAIASEMGDPLFEVDALVGLATATLALDKPVEARRLLEEGLTMANEVDPWRQHEILEGLGFTNLALGETEQGRQCFLKVLEGAVRGGLKPQALSALVGIAHLLAEVEPVRALELLTLALQHPATLQVTKDRAQELFSQLESELLPEVVAAARARGQIKELSDAVAETIGRNVFSTKCSPESEK